MSNTTTNPTPEKLTIAFQEFNGVFLAKISNLKGKETFAYGENKALAEQNAIRNYNTKYPAALQNNSNLLFN